ncbi:MAG: class I SAM-dependent methyltransferase [Candidatus Omnitrophota bacterium]
MKEVTLKDFVTSFGAENEGIPEECKDLINEKDFKYEILEGLERDRLLLEIIKKIENDEQIIGAKERQNVWENGWGENLQDFINSGYDLEMLVPKFIRPNQIVRFAQSYIRPSNNSFELDYYSVFRKWLFSVYFRDYENIYEFGCGTGFNLVVLSQMYPDKKLYGTDFVKSSADLVNEIGKRHNLKLTGSIFDMINPNEEFKLKEGSLIFTIGSIEQLASKFEAFLQYLLRNKPGLCVHVEPTIELYEENNLVDYFAIKFHKKRGYTQGFLPRLRELEKSGKVEILKVKRLFFGSLFMEGYNLIVWRPVK